MRDKLAGKVETYIQYVGRDHELYKFQVYSICLNARHSFFASSHYPNEPLRMPDIVLIRQLNTTIYVSFCRVLLSIKCCILNEVYMYLYSCKLYVDATHVPNTFNILLATQFSAIFRQCSCVQTSSSWKFMVSLK